ncbi:MAG TPA: hypothetical protein VMD92_15830 [Acidobacteriaceae bacterium]|nr:hypothetical protein [Acidobacteriaceae bacterium]HTW49424.1 hypothetical protein [Acidobacteriaceae bacterium]
MLNLTVAQILTSLVAIPAWTPFTICPGYLTAWFLDLHGFRRRSVAERLLWSVPLSLAVATIAALVISWSVSLTAAAAVLAVCLAATIGVVVREWGDRRRTGQRWVVGWHPGGGVALSLALVWVAFAILSLVDFGRHGQLYFSVTLQDMGSRVNWTQAVLRTGVPPMNPLYLYHHAAHLRQYYFWYVNCAVVTRLWHLPVRAVFMAGCVWSGFALAALTGLYLKHLLASGGRVRRHFLTCIALLGVTGLDILAVFVGIFFFGSSLPLDLEWWSRDQITSWMDSLLWVPHHIAGLACCMLAFLLAWKSKGASRREWVMAAALIGCALASAFGLSVYVTFAFFLVMVLWAIWQIAVERSPAPVGTMAGGGALSLLLLVPYLRELLHGSSDVQGGSLFGFGVREMIPPEWLLRTGRLEHLVAAHPVAARQAADWALLLPGYALELGFYLAVLLIFLIPAWRGRVRLSEGQRAMLFLAVATLPVISILRSQVISNNDFGWRAALFVQFPLLLLGAQLITDWNGAREKMMSDPGERTERLRPPAWLRVLASTALLIGILSTVSQVLALRFGLVMMEANMRALHKPEADRLSHTAWITTMGHRQLDARIPQSAVVQYNPHHLNQFFGVVDQLADRHQVAVSGDTDGCGSTLGGDPRGCPIMGAALDAIFHGASADQARHACRAFGIQYLVADVYDPAWNDSGGWVWTLPAVVADPEFRALDCR